MWIITLIILAIAAYFLIQYLRKRAESTSTHRDALEHDSEGSNRPLPGQRAGTSGEIHDAAREHVGAHLEKDDGTLDADVAARAADDIKQTGGTGGAVLAGVATAAAAGATRAMAGGDSVDKPVDAEQAAADASLTNPPQAETAGGPDAERATGGRTVTSDDRPTASAQPGGVPSTGQSGDETTASGQSIRDNRDTNAPVGDAEPGKAARDRVPGPVDRADNAAAATGTESRTNPPIVADRDNLAGRDRVEDSRSTLAAGTATLATAAGGLAAGGGEGNGDSHDTNASDVAHLNDGDQRDNVREMMKILNLRDSDASRLDISKEDFARLWQADASASDTLVDDVSKRLRAMLH